MLLALLLRPPNSPRGSISQPIKAARHLRHGVERAEGDRERAIRNVCRLYGVNPMTRSRQRSSRDAEDRDGVTTTIGLRTLAANGADVVIHDLAELIP